MPERHRAAVLTSRDMNNCGTSGGRIPGTSATGATLSDVPMTMTRSARSRSCLRSRCLNSSGKSSPKKVISGCEIVLLVSLPSGRAHLTPEHSAYLHYTWRRYIVFSIGGIVGASTFASLLMQPIRATLSLHPLRTDSQLFLA